jgi:hypothetical protein
MVGRMTSIWFLCVFLLLSICASAASADPAPFARGGSDRLSIPAGPLGTGLASRALPPAAAAPGRPDFTTVPLWAYRFQYHGVLFGSNMVGTDPAAGSATTVVPVTIVPLRLSFARDGAVMDYPGMADELAASSVFTPFPFLTGTTQFLDAYRRADFWQQVSATSPDYHTLLGGPTIAPVQRWSVPAAMGLTFVDAGTNRRFAIADGDWFFHQLNQTIASLQIDPRSLVVFLAYNTDVTFQSSPDSCFTTGCNLFGGFHGAITSGNPNLGAVPPQTVNTYAYATFQDLGALVPPALNEHLAPVSHELLEWLDDPILIGTDPSQPFGPTAQGSLVPPWSSPFYPLCSNVYEVADPLERSLVLGVPNPSSGKIDLFANAVFHDWFARTASTSLFGRYDVAGVFQGPSDPC